MLHRLGLVFLASMMGCGGDGGHSDARPADARPADAAPGTVALTVKNFQAWCSVSVNGGAASAAGMQVVDVVPGPIALTAVAEPGFQLGTTPWHDTDGDTGLGEQGTITGTGQTAQSAATITVAAAACAWVCCEFTGGGGCPATDQCP